MAETKMNVTLIAHTQLSEGFKEGILSDIYRWPEAPDATDGQAVALTAIRTCYSANKPSEIIAIEGAKYFGKKASDGGKGTEADRLIRHISNSGHLSTLEHITFTFAVEGVSRALLAQLTRHRVGFSFSVQSQRYVKFGSDDRSGGFDHVRPENISDDKWLRLSGDKIDKISAIGLFYEAMKNAQESYDKLREAGVPAEDARAVLPQATACNLVMTANLRSLLDFYGKRNEETHAQGEIQSLSENLRKAVAEVEPWTDALFEATKRK
ncbi:FAD-dependent thymidylate synthase [Gottfriedia sp. S16(2024)]|uniref:FAD-dependent thymidylate synthase n=1 Tax=Gottfriedia sp. S16(2024) TaxID=3162883 RepID=UPI003D1BE08E